MVGLRPSRAVLPSVLLRLVERRGTMRCRSTESGQEGVRVRFAPSPTGNLHVGGARTALYNYLYAQQKKAEETGSAFVLRVEDTDKARSTKESEDAVLRDLTWLGLDWDEGPLRQSERGDLYQRRAKELLEKNLAYKCFCTDDEITEMKEKAAAEGLPPVYSGKWASATEAEVQAMVDAGEPYAVRFRVPQDELVTIHDAIRGQVTWNTNTLGDFIILRSDGTPVYNFCVAVDDADMRITEVVRAEEHLPNTLRQVLIYNALGLSAPKFAHCSLILAPDRSKLSKRHGATSVGEFKEEGYLSEALVNYLALLGWNDGTEQEFFSKDELVSKFSLERINPSAAVFDKKKLNFFNAQVRHTISLPPLPPPQNFALTLLLLFSFSVHKKSRKGGPRGEVEGGLAQEGISKGGGGGWRSGGQGRGRVPGELGHAEPEHRGDGVGLDLSVGGDVEAEESAKGD